MAQKQNLELCVDNTNKEPMTKNKQTIRNDFHKLLKKHIAGNVDIFDVQYIEKIKELAFALFANNAKNAIFTLSRLYPKCFNWKDSRPIKIDINKDLRADEKYNKKQFLTYHYALHYYTHRDQYLENMTEGTARLDLHGNPCTKVTLNEELHASFLKQIPIKQRLNLAPFIKNYINFLQKDNRHP